MLYQEVFQQDEDPNSQNHSMICYFNHRSNGYEGSFPLHTHSFYELDYTFDGGAIFEFDNRTVTASPGSLLFFPPLSIHGGNHDTRQQHLILQFSTRMLQNNLPGFTENNILLPDGRLLEQGQLILTQDSTPKLHRIMQELASAVPVYHTYDSGSGPQQQKISPSPICMLHQTAQLLSLLAELLSQGMLRISNSSLNTSILPKMHQLLKQLTQYPEEKLSMEEAASMLNMSYSNFCRTFKHTTGYAYVDFCNLQRITRAKELLKYTDLSVTEISMRLNFGSISYFNRIFKKFTGTPPLTYRTFSRNSQ